MGSRISSTLSVACRDLSIRQREQAAAEERFILDIHDARTQRHDYSLLLRRAQRGVRSASRSACSLPLKVEPRNELAHAGVQASVNVASRRVRRTSQRANSAASPAIAPRLAKCEVRSAWGQPLNSRFESICRRLTGDPLHNSAQKCSPQSGVQPMEERRAHVNYRRTTRTNPARSVVVL